MLLEYIRYSHNYRLHEYMCSMTVDQMSVEELCCYIQEELQGIGDVLDNIRKHKIDGETFLQLNEEYLS